MCPRVRVSQVRRHWAQVRSCAQHHVRSLRRPSRVQVHRPFVHGYCQEAQVSARTYARTHARTQTHTRAHTRERSRTMKRTCNMRTVRALTRTSLALVNLAPRMHVAACLWRRSVRAGFCRWGRLLRPAQATTQRRWTSTRPKTSRCSGSPSRRPRWPPSEVSDRSAFQHVCTSARRHLTTSKMLYSGSSSSVCRKCADINSPRLSLQFRGFGSKDCDDRSFFVLCL